IKEKLKNSLQYSQFSSPPQSPQLLLLPITEEIDNKNAFDDEDLEEFNQFGQEKLYENLCQYWNFQDPNILLATLLDSRTKRLKDVSIQVKLQTEELLHDKVEELKLETLSLPNLTSPDSTDSTPTKIKYKNSIFTKFQKSQSKVVNYETFYLQLNNNGLTILSHKDKHYTLSTYNKTM
ncbi:17419_t:CDS:2, partial [Funneliformis caledonium]